jgi:hypothetical protein
MPNPNYEYICKNYTLPEWFNYNDIDWLRYYPAKDGKIYECNTKRTINKMIKEEKRGFTTNIYDDEKVEIHKIFVKYLAYINDMSLDNDLTDEEMKKLLSIKICDYDWLFMWSNPVYDKDSEELLLQKNISVKENNTEVVKSFWFHISDDYRSGRSIYTYTKPPKYEKNMMTVMMK